MNVKAQRGLLLVALIVAVGALAVGALMLSTGLTSTAEAQSLETQQPSTPPADASAAEATTPEVGAAETTQQQPTADSSQQLSQLNSEGALVYRHEETGEVRFIGASNENPIDRPATLAEDASPEEAARAHLAELGKLFGI